MATTVNNAFDEFIRDHVNLDNDVTARAHISREWLKEKVMDFDKADERFPVSYPEINTGFGSFDRKTKIRPLDDIDLMFGLDADDCYYTILHDKITISIREDTKRLKYYLHDNSINVNSRKIINAYVGKLSDIHQYAQADIGRNQEAATLKLVSYDWNFDIVPCFMTQENALGISYYLIPDGNGNWKKTDPRIDKARTTALNVRMDGHMLKTIRLVKYWQKRHTMPSIQSYMLETMLLNYFDTRESCTRWVDLSFIDVVNYLQSAIYYSVMDQKKIQGDLNTLSYEDKVKIANKCSEDLTKARGARLLEQADDQQGAIAKWREIMGDNFPRFG